MRWLVRYVPELPPWLVRPGPCAPHTQYAVEVTPSWVRCALDALVLGLISHWARPIHEFYFLSSSNLPNSPVLLLLLLLLRRWLRWPRWPGIPFIANSNSTALGWAAVLCHGNLQMRYIASCATPCLCGSFLSASPSCCCAVPLFLSTPITCLVPWESGDI